MFHFQLLNCFSFRGVTNDQKVYESTLNLFGEVKVDESKWQNRDRGADVVLVKASPGPYWARLLKENTKYHWLKIDFNKWKDEDESDDEADPMAGMGGMPGMGGMGGMGGMPGMGGLGGMGGGANLEEMMRQMGGMGGPGGDGAFNALDDLGDDEVSFVHKFV